MNLLVSCRPPRRSLPRSVIALCLALAALFASTARAEPAADRPAVPFDPARWKLTLPVNAMGRPAGKAAEVAHLRDYAAPPYFYTAADGGLVFWAPVNGATTDGSAYPRSELREIPDPARWASSWTDASDSVPEAELKVGKLPAATGKLVIGQIHGCNTAPLLKLQYESGGRLVALINPKPASSSPLRYTLATGLRLNRVFAYRIAVSAGVLSMSAGGRAPVRYVIDPSWRGVGLYFKLGAYVQASGGSGNDGGQAVFYHLAATHPDLARESRVSAPPVSSAPRASRPES